MKILRTILQVIIFTGLKIWEIIFNPIRKLMIFLWDFIGEYKKGIFQIIMVFLLLFSIGATCLYTGWGIVGKPNEDFFITMSSSQDILLKVMVVITIGMVSSVIVICPLVAVFLIVSGCIIIVEWWHDNKITYKNNRLANFIKSNWKQADDITNKIFKKEK